MFVYPNANKNNRADSFDISKMTRITFQNSGKMFNLFYNSLPKYADLTRNPLIELDF